jgi:hypothetical protein
MTFVKSNFCFYLNHYFSATLFACYVQQFQLAMQNLQKSHKAVVIAAPTKNAQVYEGVCRCIANWIFGHQDHYLLVLSCLASFLEKILQEGDPNKIAQLFSEPTLPWKSEEVVRLEVKKLRLNSEDNSVKGDDIFVCKLAAIFFGIRIVVAFFDPQDRNIESFNPSPSTVMSNSAFPEIWLAYDQAQKGKEWFCIGQHPEEFIKASKTVSTPCPASFTPSSPCLYPSNPIPKIEIEAPKLLEKSRSGSATLPKGPLEVVVPKSTLGASFLDEIGHAPKSSVPKASPNGPNPVDYSKILPGFSFDTF